MNKRLIYLIFFTLIFLFYFSFDKNTFQFYPSQLVIRNSSNQYVLMAINIDNTSKQYYFFYLPFIVEAWKIIGFKSVVLVVSSLANNLESLNNNNTLVMKTIEYLKKQEIVLILVKAEKDYGKITAMVCRLFVGVVKEIKDEDFVITSDSDLVPIKKNYYNFENKDAITVLNGFCCGTFIHNEKKYEMYPMGHIGMKKKIWREVLNLSKETEINSESIIHLVRTNLGGKIVKKDDEIARGDATWGADQTILSTKISQYVHDLKKATLIKKKYTGIRYDRSRSDSSLIDIIKNNFEKITDFHAFHSSFMNRWNRSDELFKKLFNTETYYFLNQYYIEFKKLTIQAQ